MHTLYQKQKWEDQLGQFMNPAFDNYQKISTHNKFVKPTLHMLYTSLPWMAPKDKNICLQRKKKKNLLSSTNTHILNVQCQAMSFPPSKC